MGHKKMIFPSQERITGRVNHLLDVFIKSECQIRPHFFLTGPSGSGKSFLTNMLCLERKIPFIEINAAQLTAEGLSGNSLSKALRPLRNHWNVPNVVFVDEFDKLFQRNGENTEGFRSAVQDEFLGVLENKYASVFTDYGKYEPVEVEKCLFIFAGAFSNKKITETQHLKDAGLRTEFVGRVPLVFSTDEVTLNELLNALPSVALLQQYLLLNPSIRPAKAVKEIGASLTKMSEDRELQLGVRSLNLSIHRYFMKHL